jgi:hypothetical protein
VKPGELLATKQDRPGPGGHPGAEVAAKPAASAAQRPIDQFCAHQEWRQHGPAPVHIGAICADRIVARRPTLPNSARCINAFLCAGRHDYPLPAIPLEASGQPLDPPPRRPPCRLGALTSFVGSVIDWTQIGQFWVRRSAWGGVFAPGQVINYGVGRSLERGRWLWCRSSYSLTGTEGRPPSWHGRCACRPWMRLAVGRWCAVPVGALVE